VLRVVLDPGVLIAALISPSGSPAHLIRRWQEGLFDLLLSPTLLNELAAALSRDKFRKYVTRSEAMRFVVWIRYAGVLLNDPPRERRLTPDPGDDYLVALAQSTDADLIVSGDRHLTELRNPRPPVLSPKEFLEQLTPLS
jgi:uncharacterized protein